MDKYLLALLCQGDFSGENLQKCQQAVVMTIKEVHIYKTIKENEKKLRLMAEEKLTKPVFWSVSTLVASGTMGGVYITGHNFLGLDTVSLQINKSVQLSTKIAF
jgi:hypothetical protein